MNTVTNYLKSSIAWVDAHIVAGAQWLVKAAGLASADIATMETSHPLAKLAADAAIHEAVAAGLPIAAFEQVGADVLAAAKVIAGGGTVAADAPVVPVAAVVTAPAPLVPGMTTVAAGATL